MTTPVTSASARGRSAWNVAVFTSREPPAVVERTVEALQRACTAADTIDVLVNGDPANACRIAEALAARTGSAPRLRVWNLALGDKAHTWNEFLHRLWLPDTELAIFVDGYVRVRPDALRSIDSGLRGQPSALVATGVPTSGPSAAKLRRTMHREGGIHGNLYALPSATLCSLRESGYRLPLGIYRTDPTLAAALAFGLEPATGHWLPRERIAIVDDATWDVEPRRWWLPSEWRANARRRARQAQGDLENRAVSFIYGTLGRAAHTLPRTSRELVIEWAQAQPEALSALLRRTAVRKAYNQLMQPCDWSAAERAPELLLDVPARS